MKQFCALLLAAAMLCTLSACGDSSGNAAPLDISASSMPSASEIPSPPESSAPENSGAGESRQESASSEPAQTPEPTSSEVQAAQEAQPSAQPAENGDDGGKILIAYFTWADNTVVEDADADIASALRHYDSVGDADAGVDAVASASILAPGNAARIAGWIQQEVGGDLHSIVVEEPYPSNYDECLDRVADEKVDNARPALRTHVENMEDYDIVFLGFPNWWYTLPMPVLTFVEEYDLSGKTIVPFVTHGTGGLSATIRDLTAALPEGTVILDEIGVYRSEVTSSQSAVLEWLRGLDLEY